MRTEESIYDLASKVLLPYQHRVDIFGWSIEVDRKVVLVFVPNDKEPVKLPSMIGDYEVRIDLLPRPQAHAEQTKEL